MKILLDENIPAKLKFDFDGFWDINTVRDMNWLGKKNGALLGLAVLNGFDVFITLDRSLVKQQNLKKLDIKVVVLHSKNNKHQTLQSFIQKIKLHLSDEDSPDVIQISMD